MVVTSASMTPSAAKGQPLKHKAAIAILALFTVARVISLVVLEGKITDHRLESADDEVECGGASHGTDRCYEARIFREWHNSAADAVDGGSSESSGAEASDLASDAGLDNETLLANVHVMEVWRTVSQVGVEESATQNDADVSGSIELLPIERSEERAGHAEDVSAHSRRHVWTFLRDFQENHAKSLKSDHSNATADTKPLSSDLEEVAQDPATGEAQDGDTDDSVQKFMRGLQEGLLKSLQQPEWRAIVDSSPVTERASAVDKQEPDSAWKNAVNALEQELSSSDTQVAEWESDIARMQARLQAHAPTQAESSTTSMPDVRDSTANLAQDIWAYGEELCKDPRRRDFASCAHFLAHDHAATQTVASAVPSVVDTSSLRLSSAPASESRYERQHNLHWREVKSWRTATKSLRGSAENQAFAVVMKDAVRFSKWGGMIPKVACIAVVPFGKDIKYQLTYFLDGFRLQNYEGPKQLVLVYHRDDLAAKKVLLKYHDGVTVKVVAGSMGEKHDDVSTLYRFGAWAANDAEVIARWDFDAWHHPSRLSMQIRAMALAQRPASRLTNWTVRSTNEAPSSENAQTDSVGEASLVGEKDWMAQYWYPTLLGESDTLSKANSKHVVQFDFSELLVYNMQA